MSASHRARTWLPIILAYTLISLLTGCGNPQESARKELAKLGKDFSPASFIESVGNDDKQAVRLFIEAGMDVNATIDQGFTALAIASMKGDPEMVKMLLDKGANPNVALTSGSEKGTTPLMAATMSGHVEVVKLLLSKGADINAKDDRGLIAVDYATERAASKDDPAVLRLLWEHGAPQMTEAQLAKILDEFRQGLRLKAVKSMMAGDSPDACRNFVAEQLSNFKNQAKFTTDHLLQARVCAFNAVWDAVVGFSANSVGLADTDKNRQALKGFEPFCVELQKDPEVQREILFAAAQKGEISTLKWLLKQGADVNAKTEAGFTPLAYAIQLGEGPGAAKTVELLLDAGADCNQKYQMGMTATMYAVAGGRTEILKMLIARKPDVNAANSKGQTALMMAKATNNAEAVVLLKEAGATESE